MKLTVKTSREKSNFTGGGRLLQNILSELSNDNGASAISLQNMVWTMPLRISDLCSSHTISGV